MAAGVFVQLYMFSINIASLFTDSWLQQVDEVRVIGLTVNCTTIIDADVHDTRIFCFEDHSVVQNLADPTRIALHVKATTIFQYWFAIYRGVTEVAEHLEFPAMCGQHRCLLVCHAFTIDNHGGNVKECEAKEDPDHELQQLHVANDPESKARNCRFFDFCIHPE